MSIFNVLSRIKELIRKIIKAFCNRKILLKIRHNLEYSDIILKEKGYHKKQYYDYNDNEIHVYLTRDPPFIAEGASYKNGILSLRFNNNLEDLLEASLTIYCWTCLLPGLSGSKYQQYIRRCKGYVDSQQDTDSVR